MNEKAQTRQRTRRSFARSPQQIDRARGLRQSATAAEKIAWQLLRRFRQDGFIFRRQQPLGRCVVDFCCLEERLIIELDGSVHAQPSQAGRDAKRDEWLRRLGYAVVRFPNGLVTVPEEFAKRVLRVLTNLRAARTARARATVSAPPTPSPPAPLPQRGRGESGRHGSLLPSPPSQKL